MPTYVYECSACTKTFEVEQRITEAPLTTCECGCNGTVKRVIQPVGISFKGSGFYVNDSVAAASPAKPKEAEPAAAEKTAPEGSPEAPKPAEATPAPAPAAAPSEKTP